MKRGVEGIRKLSQEAPAVAERHDDELAKECPSCKASFPADMRFCPQDGTALPDAVSENGSEHAKNSEHDKDSENRKNSENGKSSVSPHTEHGESSEYGLISEQAPSLDIEPSMGANPSETATLNMGVKPGTSLVDPRLELLGTVVEDRYEVTETLGKGGMSVVFKARDRRLKKVVALKVLMPHLSADPLSVQRFQQEATAASHLDHPNIVKVYNVGTTESGLPFMAMDYLAGHSLSTLIKENGRLEYLEALGIFVQLTAALAHAHEKRVIHRDLKPSNVILSKHGEESEVAKLVDFGIAKVLSQDGQTQAKLTQTGDVFGSPHYMSPEQCLGGELDERSDIYSMGCLMYEALTGKPPHTGESTLQILHKHISETPASFKTLIPETSASTLLEALVFKCLAPKRDDRIQSMKLLKNELAKLYMIRDKNPINQAMAKLSLAWAKRPKLTAREKLLYSVGVMVSVMVIYAATFVLSFLDLTANSPWLGPDILTWVPPKPPGNSAEDKAALGFSQVDMYINKAGTFIKEGVMSPGQLVKTLTNAGLGLEQNGRLEDAARCLDKAAEVAEFHISKYSTSFANLCFYKGRVYYEMQKYDLAAKNLRLCLDSNEWPASHQWKGDCEAMLADCYNFMGNRTAAEDFYQQALDRWKHYDCDSARFSITAVRFADLIMPYKTPKSYTYAYNLFKAAKYNWRRTGISEGQNIALCDLRISQVLADSADKEESFRYLKEANEGMANSLGEDNPKRTSLMMKYADALWQRGKRIAALQERFRCWQILNHAPPPVTVR